MKSLQKKKTLVLIDYANLKASARYLNKHINLQLLYNHFRANGCMQVAIYYGTDHKNPKSYKFIKWLRKIGYVVVTKDVKYIKIKYKDSYIFQKKCNLDIEIALDMFIGFENYDSFILFTGDSDFEGILKLARSKGKYITIISLRKFTAGEVITNCDKYINLTKFSKKVAGLLFDA